MNFKVIGTGSYVPEFTLSNNDLANMVETSDEWITQRVGVKIRHISTGEGSADFAYEAAKRALEMSGTLPKDLDLIIVATFTGETLVPTVAGTVQMKLGATCPAFDLNTACSGFIFALDVASGYFARGKVKKALIIGSERLSKIIDWTDRNTCVIFGDGAGAAVLEAGENFLASEIYTHGENEVLYLPSFKGASPFDKKEYDKPYLFMDGQETFKFAVNAITSNYKAAAESAGVALSDIAYFVPHQANIRIIQYAAKRLGVPQEKFFVNIDKYGNTSAASVPIALDELNRSGKLKENDLVALAAFGGGLSSGACIIKW